MQHVDQNMDDLFRNAAENYQLKNGQDWDKIAPYLTSSVTPTVAAVMPKSKKPWLILATLLMCSPLLLLTLKKDNPIPEAQSIAILTHEQQSKNPDQTTISKINPAPSVPYASEKIEKIKSILTEIPTVIKKEISKQNQLAPESSSNNTSLQTLNFNEKREIQIQTKINTTINPGNNTDQAAAASIPVKKTPEIRGLYLGLLAGPQWNQVEGQGFNKPGLNIGLIAGFSFNKKLAIESGISYSNKYYYSDGQHFHMKKNPGAPSMKVISLEGSSNVIEIPAKIKYDVIDNKKGEVFITAGLSTYILTKENNQYYALINGTPQNSNVIYKDRKTYVAGGMNLSAGYSIHLKKKTDIRIEPYLQVPFKGTGVGSMRVTTTGLNIGITRNLHK